MSGFANIASQNRNFNAACSKPRLLFVVTEDWYFVSHRLRLAQAAVQDGFVVAVATHVREQEAILAASGLRVFPLKKLKRTGCNPWCEIQAIAELFSIYRAWRPDIVHHVALKPIIYGSIAVLLAGVRARVNALAGLGFIFSSKSMKAKLFRYLIQPLLVVVLRGTFCRVILQNPDDVKVLTSIGVSKEAIRLIKGAGVDLERFNVHLTNFGRPIVILAARLLWDKGVGDFVKVSQALRDLKVDARFVLVGDSDLANPSAVPRSQLEAWHQSGDIEWWGRRSDMPKVFGAATIVCLPSTYGEGIPKVLIEAAACGKPLVAYDVPGCREIVRDGENGILVPPGDVLGVVAAVKMLLEDAELRTSMGGKSRQMAVSEFSDVIVNSATLDVYRELLAT